MAITGAELKRWNSVNASDEARCAVQDPAKDPERMLAGPDETPPTSLIVNS